MQEQNELLSFSNSLLLVIMVLIALVGIVAPIMALLPVWIASPTIIFGWFLIGNACWLWESWRASGPRGLFINPARDGVADLRVTFAWFFFGIFLVAINVALRAEWIYLNEQGKISLKKN